MRVISSHFSQQFSDILNVQNFSLNSRDNNEIGIYCLIFTFQSGMLNFFLFNLTFIRTKPFTSVLSLVWANLWRCLQHLQRCTCESLLVDSRFGFLSDMHWWTWLRKMRSFLSRAACCTAGRTLEFSQELIVSWI